MADSYPRSLNAPTGRAKCVHCSKPIAVGTIKIEVAQDVRTPRGIKQGSASLHPECALAWVAASKFPGGKRSFCKSLVANGEVPIPDLASTDTRPEGSPQLLEGLLPQWGTTSDIAAIRSALEGHAWSAFTLQRFLFRALGNTSPDILTDVVRAFVAAAEPDERAAVAETFFQRTLLDHKQEALSLELLRDCGELSGETVGPLIQYATPPLLTAAAAKICPRDRTLAWISTNPIAGREYVSFTGKQAQALLTGFDPEVERNGLYAIHVAVIAGNAESIDLMLAPYVTRPLGADLRLTSFAAGPRAIGPKGSAEDGSTPTQIECLAIELKRGATPMEIVDAILDSGERARKDVERNALYTKDTDRAARLAAISQTIDRYRATREALIRHGAVSAEAAKAASVPHLDAAFDRLYAAIGRTGERPSVGVPSGRWAALQWQLQNAKGAFAALAENQVHPFTRLALQPLSWDGYLGGRTVHLYNSTTETGWDWDSSAHAIDRDALPPAAREAATNSEPIGSSETSLWLLSQDDRLTEIGLAKGEVRMHGPVDEVFARVAA